MPMLGRAPCLLVAAGGKGWHVLHAVLLLALTGTQQALSQTFYQAKSGATSVKREKNGAKALKKYKNLILEW